MTTYQDFIYSSNPLNRHIVSEIGLVRGAVASKIIYACNLKDGVCRMGQRRMAEELGVDRSTISRAETYLIEEKYIFVTRPATDTEPAHLKPTKKLLDLIETVAERNPPVAQNNPPVAECNQEEETKEESEQSLSYKAKPSKNPKPKSKPKTPTLDDYGPLGRSLLLLCKLDPVLVNGTKLDYLGVMRFFAAKEVQPARVVEFGQWYGQTPTLKAITDYWGRFEAGELPPHKQYQKNGASKNGHKPSKPEKPQSERMEQYVNALK